MLSKTLINTIFYKRRTLRPRMNKLHTLTALLITSFGISLMQPLLCTEVFAEPASENVSSEQTTEVEEVIDTSWPSAPEIFAECGVLIEASTGTVLYDKSANLQMYPASITKIMTTLLALENGNLSDMVEFSRHSVYSIEAGAAHISRDQGELLSLNDCLYAVMLASANEVSNAVGEYIAKKQPAFTQKLTELQASGAEYNESLVAQEVFANMMNERAVQCGTLNTHFNNPHGLFDENHWTTCYDMAMITREAIQNEQFMKIQSQTSYVIPTTNLKTETLPISNRHKMLFPRNTVYYEGILGGKTGYVDQSGNTLVTFAKRNGMTLISVVMRSNSSNVYNDTALLLDYGFEHFALTNIAANEKNFTPSSHSILASGSSIFSSSSPLITMNEDDNVVLPTKVPFEYCTTSITYPENSNDTFATLTYKLNDKVVGSTTLTVHNPENDENGFDFGPMLEDETTTAPPEEEKYINVNIVKVLVILLVVAILGVAGYYFYQTQPTRSKRRKRRRRRAKRREDDYIIRNNFSGFSRNRKKRKR